MNRREIFESRQLEQRLGWVGELQDHYWNSFGAVAADFIEFCRRTL